MFWKNTHTKKKELLRKIVTNKSCVNVKIYIYLWISQYKTAIANKIGLFAGTTKRHTDKYNPTTFAFANLGEKKKTTK